MITPKTKGWRVHLPAGLERHLGRHHARGPAAAGTPGQLAPGRGPAAGQGVKVTLEYWWKTSVNTADNSQFLNTGLLYPIAAAKGRFHGLDLRIDVIPVHGWSGYLSAGTVRTIFYNPTVGGLDAASAGNQGNSPYLIDHDEKLTAQAGLRYDHQGFFGQVVCRYDSGLVAGDPTAPGVANNPDYAFGIPTCTR